MVAMKNQTSQRSVVLRLQRAEGQVRAIKQMIERGTPCMDVLIQIAAARAALGKVALLVAESKLRTVMAAGDETDVGEERLRELLAVLQHVTR